MTDDLKQREGVVLNTSRFISTNVYCFLKTHKLSMHATWSKSSRVKIPLEEKRTPGKRQSCVGHLRRAKLHAWSLRATTSSSDDLFFFLLLDLAAVVLLEGEQLAGTAQQNRQNGTT
jgi:hypothetical protein